MILGFGYCFYALFVFDTIGGAIGFDEAYWALIVMPLTTVGIYIMLRLYRYYQERNTGVVQHSPSLDGRSVEMIESSHFKDLSAASSTEHARNESEDNEGAGTINILLQQQQLSAV